MLGDFAANLLFWCMLLLAAGWVQGLAGGLMNVRRNGAAVPTGSVCRAPSTKAAHLSQICSV